jgi:hypothetical protein
VTVVVSGCCTTSNAAPASGEAFTLTTSGSCDALVKVYADSSTDIGRITLTGSGTGTVSLLIGSSGTFPTDQTTPFSSFLSRDWNGLTLSSFSGTVRVASAVGRDLTQSVTADQIFRADVVHDVEALMTATAVDPSSIIRAVGPVIVGHSITSAGGVAATATPGTGETLNIAEVKTGAVSSGSDMAGSISTDHGTTLSLIAADDLSGTVSANVLGDSDAPGEDDAITVGVGTSGVVTGTLTFYDVCGNVVADSFASGALLDIEHNLLASVLTVGDITTIHVGGDVEGVLESPLQIVSSEGGIGSITVDGALNGETAHAIFINAPDGVGAITCTTMSGTDVGPQNVGSGAGIPLGTVEVAGDVYGSTIHATTIDSLDIEGSLASNFVAIGDPPDYTLIAAGRVVVLSVDSGTRLRIGGGIGIFAYLKTEDSTPALAGQVIVNGFGVTGTPLVGNVLVRHGISAYTIDEADYGIGHVTLGGGAVGVVPFGLNLSDCDPPYNPDGDCDLSFTTKTWPASFGNGSTTSTRETIVLQFYGPVFDHADTYGDPDNPSTKPIKIERVSYAIPDPPVIPEDYGWYTQTALYDVYVPGGGSREVWISTKLDGSYNPQAISTDFHYRVTPVVSSGHTVLRSDKTFVSPSGAPDVADFTYEISGQCNETRPPG